MGVFAVVFAALLVAFLALYKWLGPIAHDLEEDDEEIELHHIENRVVEHMPLQQQQQQQQQEEEEEEEADSGAEDGTPLLNGEPALHAWCMFTAHKNVHVLPNINKYSLLLSHSLPSLI